MDAVDPYFRKTGSDNLYGIAVDEKNRKIRIDTGTRSEKESKYNVAILTSWHEEFELQRMQ